MTGRRPNLSDKTPSTGEKKNCISANTVPKTPFQVAAELMLPPRKSRINFGNTGAINPSASMSSMTVTKMNGIAAWRFFIARGASTQRCSGGCVTRGAKALAAASAFANLLSQDDAAFLHLTENGGAGEHDSRARSGRGYRDFERRDRRGEGRAHC